MFSISYAVFVATVIGSMYTEMKIQNASSLSNTVQVCSEAWELTISSSLTVKRSGSLKFGIHYFVFYCKLIWKQKLGTWRCLQKFSHQACTCSEFIMSLAWIWCVVLFLFKMGSVGLELSKAFKYVCKPIFLQWSIWGKQMLWRMVDWLVETQDWKRKPFVLNTVLCHQKAEFYKFSNNFTKLHFKSRQLLSCLPGLKHPLRGMKLSSPLTICANSFVLHILLSIQMFLTEWGNQIVKSVNTSPSFCNYEHKGIRRKAFRRSSWN